MEDLVAWLCVQLDEDERVARAASSGRWSVDSAEYAERITSSNGVDVVAGGRWGGEASVFESTDDAIHIVRWDPARVLTEVEAKRRVLDEHREHAVSGAPMAWCVTCCETAPGEERESSEWPCSTLRLLALPYADRSGYRQEWAL